MLKQIKPEFILTRALPQLLLVHSRPYVTSFPGLLLSLALTSKVKKTLEASLDLTPPFKRAPLTQGLRVSF